MLRREHFENHWNIRGTFWGEYGISATNKKEYKETTGTLQGMRFLWDWSLGTHPAR